jgi:hypothetical protein
MLDRMIQDAFERMAGSDQPPARVSITHAIRQARVQRRRQRLTAAGGPVLAAGAALAIGLTGVIGSGLANRAQPPAGGSTASTVAAPKYFNPLRPYAAFGWLPGGASARRLGYGLFGQDELLLTASRAELTMYAADRCTVGGHALSCNVAGQKAPSQVLGRPVGEVDGHPAYWFSVGVAHRVSRIQRPPLPGLTGTLTWQYARGGWAALSVADLRDALRIADSVRFGPDISPPVRFAFQLTGVPADWQVNALTTGWRDGVQYASSYQITAGRVDAVPEGDYPATTPFLEAGPRLNAGCAGVIFYGAHSAVINGYHVTLGGDKKFWPQYELCAPDADGLFVVIYIGARPTISPVNLFAHHLRLLGSDPAHWTTQPIR